MNNNMTVHSYCYYNDLGGESNHRTNTFWKYTTIHPTILVISHGKCGLRGKHTIKSFPSPRVARKFLRDQRKHKYQTGFVEKTSTKYLTNHLSPTVMFGIDRQTKQKLQAYLQQHQQQQLHKKVDSKNGKNTPYKKRKSVKTNTKPKRTIVPQRQQPKQIQNAPSPYKKMGLAGHKAPNVRNTTNGKP